LQAGIVCLADYPTHADRLVNLLKTDMPPWFRPV
jgi:hypothetical protein